MKLLGRALQMCWRSSASSPCSPSGARPCVLGPAPRPASNRQTPCASPPTTSTTSYIVLGQTEGRWSEADFADRKHALDAAFKALGADIVAFQEMESFAWGAGRSTNLALTHLLEQNPGFAAAAVGDADQFPITQPILYRKSALTPLDQGWFFFSDTPDVIYSRTYNGSWPAFASWAKFQTTTGEAFRVLNIHFDFSSRSNRRLSAALVAERLTPWLEAGETVFLVGDTNELLGSSIMDSLTAPGLTFLDTPGATYHLDRGLNLFGAIDHIAHSPGASPLGPPSVYREKPGNRWPSDHYPVIADFALQ